jgi:hypothetical protein
MKIKDLNPNSKIWMYSSNRELKANEINYLENQLAHFVNNWSSHGSSLLSAAEVVNPYFVAFAVDLSKENASGCSLDKSTRFLKDLGLELNVDFFNRINVWIEDNTGKISSIKYAELSKYPEFYFYNQLIEKASDLNTKFKIKVKNYLENL